MQRKKGKDELLPVDDSPKVYVKSSSERSKPRVASTSFFREICGNVCNPSIHRILLFSKSLKICFILSRI